MKKILIILMLISSYIIANGFTYDKNTTCLVRQLQVHKAPKWVAKIEITNGKIEYFCSPKSMFEFYHRPGKWFDVGVKSEKDFKSIEVMDYKNLKPIDAKKAFYVYGSNIVSPAGDDLVPFSSKADADEFAKQNNGKRVLEFDKVSDKLIRLINGRI